MDPILHNLPLQLTSYIGREQETVEIQRLVTSNRLLSLTGPGGCGKTRLALETAARLAERQHFGEGIWLIELAALADAELVPQAVAAVLGVRHMSSHHLRDGLVTYLKPRKILLVLDNCEHLIEGCAHLAEYLLQRCPRLHILSTSREALRCAGEVVWPVPALSLPHETAASAMQLASVASVRLFMERATAIAPGFTLTDDNASAVSLICCRLDGMPLALELAAARINTLPVAQIAARLDNALPLLTGGGRTAAPRQQTLYATIAWSYGLLTPQEQAMLRQLSIFAGDFSLDGVEAILGIASNDQRALPGPTPPMSAHKLPEALFHLVEKSLILLQEGQVGGEGRYRILETIRQFAHSLLTNEEMQQLAEAHTRYYLHMAESIEPHLYHADRQMWMEQMVQEHDNLRAALQRELASGRIEIALRLGGTLWWFWWHRGYWSEGRGWLDAMLSQAAEDEDLQNRRAYVWALLGAGVLAWAQTDYAGANRYLEQCIQRRQLLDAASTGYALLFFSANYLGSNELTTGRAWAEESLVHMKAAAHPAGYHLALSNAGIIALFQRDTQQAIAWLEEAIVGLRRLGDRWALALPLRNLGYVAYLQEEFDRALALQRESLASLYGLGDNKWFASRSLELLAETTARIGAYQRAAVLFGASEALREAVGASVLPYYQGEYDRGVQAAKAALGDQAFAQAWSTGREMTAGNWERIIPFATDGARQDVQPTPVAPQLRIFAFGPTEVYRADTQLTSADWTYAKPKELLYYLLCQGTGTKEEIGLALWPDASPEQLRRNFHTTLHRLRQALGHAKWIVFEHNRYAFNRKRSYWFDVDWFAAGIADAHILYETDREQAIDTLTAAVALYRGEPLSDLPVDWALHLQEEWGQRYLSSLLTLGEWLFAGARYADAADFYRQAIAHDPLMEAAHRGLMYCYERLGEPGQAIRHYQNLVQLLQDELGVEPSAETTQLVDRFMKGAAR